MGEEKNWVEKLNNIQAKISNIPWKKFWICFETCQIEIA